MEFKRPTRDENIAAVWLSILEHLSENTIREDNLHALRYVNAFIKHFLHGFTQEEFTPSDEQLLRFIDFNSVISNLAAISDLRTTDTFVEILLRRRDKFGKLLALYSSRNGIRLDYKILFDADPELASRWYFAYVKNFETSCAAPVAHENMQKHIEYTDPRIKTPSIEAIRPAYFGSTYINHERDCQLKRRMNESLRSLPSLRRCIVNRPDRRKIGVFTAKWWPMQSVYRSPKPFLEALAKEYDLTLIHLGPPRKEVDTSLFREVQNFCLSDPDPEFAVFDPNDFALAYFPDIGMTRESIYLSHLRIAPIQVTSYGHPISTCGSEIDYWIAGAETEIPEGAERFYSERLVLIPGCGQASIPIPYIPKRLLPPNDHIRVACSSSSQKLNYSYLQLLRQAAERACHAVKFVFFPAVASDIKFRPLAGDVAEALGAEHVVINRSLDYAQYMQALEECHFAADAYPFGGYNSAVDILYLRKPLVALQGDRFYNRAASYLIERMGMPELVAHAPDQFVERLTRMINDDTFRHEMTRRAEKADVEKALFTREHVRFFCEAIAYLLDHRERERARAPRAPIRIA